MERYDIIVEHEAEIRQANAEIEELRAENARLRHAIELWNATGAVLQEMIESLTCPGDKDAQR